MTYKPRPIDTAGIELSPELQDLLERLAESNHDNWAQKRIDEGWSDGPERNDEKREHPDLVPYGDLAESEQEYDRKSVVETIKAMLALGYEIKPPGE